ncbi:hypothetical protein AKJ50_01805 [candidate division MSBL1 archaeon SCGC-AAA382A13]|uniref:Uncharacterized protein n=1 Tax=candidate division MSBL1 archaeon SCGC-AAA382A13 TaxID=1698279 RepID=A0A133VEZ4_9EURY|nr:hypothetical protein AKJ50_01805 [candidate division MSBL1 archaeon SCGC-AAA382A13]
MIKKLAAVCVAFFAAGFVAASLNPVRAWLEHNWPEPSIEKDNEFFKTYVSREMQMENYRIIHVGKIYPVHPWHPDPPEAYAIVRVDTPNFLKTYFLWYNNPLEKNVFYQVYEIRGEKEKKVARNVYASRPNFAIMRIMYLDDWVEKTLFPVKERGWTEENGSYVAEFTRPPNYGFFGNPPAQASYAMLLTENGRIVDIEPIKQIV